ncbi:unnamed protein product, partial [Adineta steineri]
EGGWRTAIGSWHDWYPTNHAWLHLGFHVDMNISNQVMISAAQYVFNCQDSQKIEPCRWYHVVVRVNRNRQELWVNGEQVSNADMTRAYLRHEVREPYRKSWDDSQCDNMERHRITFDKLIDQRLLQGFRMIVEILGHIHQKMIDSIRRACCKEI